MSNRKPRLQFYITQEQHDLVVTYINRSNGKWKNFTDFGAWLIEVGLDELKREEMAAVVDGEVVRKKSGEHWEADPDPSSIRPGRTS